MYLFAKSHEWLSIEGDIATIGISDFAQSELGDITYIDLPSVGDTVTIGKEFAAVESVKAASDIYSPVTGEVIEINEVLDTNPETVNAAALTDGWLIKVKVAEQASGLMSEDEYKASCTA